jgi:glycine dehydrogenase
MIPVTWPEVGRIHPFAPTNQTKGYADMLRTLEADLCVVTGFAAVSLQPNAGTHPSPLCCCNLCLSSINRL